MALLLAKGEDFASWRGVEEFAVAYRDAAVKLASRKYPEGIAPFLELLEDQLVALEHENSCLSEELAQLITELGEAQEQGQLRPLLKRWYDSAYRHFARFGSPAAFFKMSETVLSALAQSCLLRARQELDEQLPPVALVVMGPAGRLEISRFCRVQLLLVWDGTASEQLMAQLGEELVAWLRVCGVVLEETVTPRTAYWRGSLEQWHTRFEEASDNGDQSDLIELLRLADRSVLVSQGVVAERFEQLCQRFLARRNFIGNLAKRCQLLSNGIGMMGGLRLEKSGPHRGAFSLLDHAFLPLSAAVAAICLLHGVYRVGTPERLRQLVRIGKLDVDLAERALHAWHCFSEHRLSLEQQATPGQDCGDILHLSPASLSTAELDQLHGALETVADMQRYLQVSFGAYT